MKKNGELSPKITEYNISELIANRKPSWALFLVLLLLYSLATALTFFATHSSAVFMLSGYPIPYRAVTGALSSSANLCIIFLVVLYKKTGFITSLVILLSQFPSIITGLFFRHDYMGISGFFVNILIILAICLLYMNNKKIEKYQSLMQEYTTTDKLTKLPNRLAGYIHIEELIKCSEPFAVAVLNLDRFKSIKNAIGQYVGDSILKEIAVRLNTAVRKDTSDAKVFLVYNGGDEFTFVIQNYHSTDELVEHLEYYKSALNSAITLNEDEYYITSRIGYTEYPKDADNIEALYTCALVAMTNAKKHGGVNHICGFTSDMYSAEHDLEMERKIREALNDKRLHFYLQPQYDILHNLRGFEVLARIFDTDGVIINPAEFIPIAEKIGLIDNIDYTVFRESAQFLSELIKRTDTDIIFSINVSVRHLMKKDFSSEVKDVLEKNNLPANRIELEITESIMIDSFDKALNRINELKKLGIKIAIDDFGTGYSALSYLNAFPVDIIKVDKSFIENITSGNSNKQYVAAIISIGHIMNFDVIAEGVETEEQLEILREIGCDYIQGFCWGKPVPPEEAEKLIVKNVKVLNNI